MELGIHQRDVGLSRRTLQEWRPRCTRIRSVTSTRPCVSQALSSSGNRVFVTVWDSQHVEVRGRIALRRIAEKGQGLMPFFEQHQMLVEKVRSQDVQAAVAAVRAIFQRISALFDRE